MIILAYDHGAFDMFQKIKSYLDEKKLKYKEFASLILDELDNFTEFGHLANKEIVKGNIGIYGCRSGIGMSMVSNRCKGVRGALCFNVKFAEMARKHNNANVCIIPCDYVEFDNVKEIIDKFLETEFLGGKYQTRVEQLDIE